MHVIVVTFLSVVGRLFFIRLWILKSTITKCNICPRRLKNMACHKANEIPKHTLGHRQCCFSFIATLNEKPTSIIVLSGGDTCIQIIQNKIDKQAFIFIRNHELFFYSNTSWYLREEYKCIFFFLLMRWVKLFIRRLAKVFEFRQTWGGKSLTTTYLWCIKADVRLGETFLQVSVRVGLPFLCKSRWWKTHSAQSYCGTFPRALMSQVFIHRLSSIVFWTPFYLIPPCFWTVWQFTLCERRLRCQRH